MKSLKETIIRALCEATESDFKKDWDAMVAKKVPMFQFDNGSYIYLNYNEKTNQLEAGTATNSGFKTEYTQDVDLDHDLDWNLQGFYEYLSELDEFQSSEEE